MCSRIDYFSTERFDNYGLELKNQVEERLKFLSTGIKPRKNIDVMKTIFDKMTHKTEQTNGQHDNGTTLLKKKKKKDALVEEEVEEPVKKKKGKKAKVQVEDDDE